MGTTKKSLETGQFILHLTQSDVHFFGEISSGKIAILFKTFPFLGKPEEQSNSLATN